jgi:hypothetical protein
MVRSFSMYRRTMFSTLDLSMSVVTPATSQCLDLRRRGIGTNLHQ